MDPFELQTFPRNREIVVDAGYLASRRHIIYGLVELDVTRARELVGLASARGEPKISFMAFVVLRPLLPIHKSRPTGIGAGDSLSFTMSMS